MTMRGRFSEILNIAMQADEMARRVGGRFVLNDDKLRGLGMTEKQITSLHFHLAPGAYGEERQHD